MMKGWTDGYGFTDGWLKVIEEVPIPVKSCLVFTMIASKMFELSVFHPETRTEISFKKADLVSIDDGIFGAKVTALVDESDVKSAVSLNFPSFLSYCI
ncbi:hypothetical protein Hanom_Chr11g01043701 [Helianthus anomalus]